MPLLLDFLQSFETSVSRREIVENSLTFAAEVYANVPKDIVPTREIKRASEVSWNYEFFIHSSLRVIQVVR